MQEILKTNLQLNPEIIIFSSADNQIEKNNAVIIRYMTTAARLSYAQYWKLNKAHTVEEWVVKVLETAEIAKLSALIKDKSLTNFRTIWNPHWTFLLRKEEK